MSAREKFDAWERGDLQRRAEELEAELERLKAALREADDLLRRLSEWDVLNMPPGSGDDGPYWQREIARARAALGEPQP